MLNFKEANHIHYLLQNIRGLIQDEMLEMFLEKCEGDLSKIVRNSAPPLNEEEISFISENKIKAIRAYRDRTGVGLVAAKNIIDIYNTP